MRNKKGFSLVEILVASAIFSLVMLGLVSVFIAAKGQILHSRERMMSAEIGKLFIDPLQMDVRADTWAAGVASNALTLTAPGFPVYCDSVGGHTQNKNCPPSAERKINNSFFSAEYEIYDGVRATAIAGTDLRRVVTKVSWTEPSL
ncbi:MAG: prepilin-type N-terminal cleavage/methylation domain-containing protein [Candidatus Omnitrophota bacterium]